MAFSSSELSEVTLAHQLPGGIAADVDEVDARRVSWGPREGTTERLSLHAVALPRN